MDFHPRDLQVSKIYDVKDDRDAQAAIDEMVCSGFEKSGYRVLMPKEESTAKRIGYMITTGITHGLRQKGADRNIRYWTYHHDEDHYGIVLIGAAALSKLGF
ncbi:MAG: hypothetical protein D9C04_01785 [Nitrosopumilus sp. B06]|nr:MAG: hypothetical protein EB828_04145 [Nitrosopumilus sp. D6]RNJ80312.1 MAG: hypothetical protein D9C04_01785 [Nitrosopumilus sp. B06]